MTTETKPVPVNSLHVPSRFIDLCEGWAGSEACMLRAISSTGNLTTGTRRPSGCDTDEKWYVDLFEHLSVDVMHCRLMLEKRNNTDHEDYDLLCEFEEWADCIALTLRESYNLQDWDKDDE